VRVLPSPCYVISDAHLGFAGSDRERSLLEFLRGLRGRAGSLLINGDLFEFWYEWRSVMPRGGFRVLAALADLRESGMPVVLVAGNHDCWGGAILREDVGIEYVVGPWEGMLGGWRARVEHGDGLREVEDRRYRMLRRVLRHPWSVRAFRWLPADFASGIANRSSHASRTYTARDGGRGLEAVATATLAANEDLELVIFGHSHVPALRPVARGRVYANAGGWLEQPTFLVVTPEAVELRRWDGSPEGSYLDRVDHTAEKALP
jgi:UDP-2,3-diacylglucosamine hydrolase